MKVTRCWSLLASLVVLLVTFVACSGKTIPAGGVELLVVTNLQAPQDFDTVRVEVRQETGPGQWSAPLVAKDYRVPDEARLPTTFALAAGKSGSQRAQIHVIARKGAVPIVLREIITDVPKDRVVAVQVALVSACAGKAKLDGSGVVQSTCANPGESCQPDTGACGSSTVSSSSLPTYAPGDEERIVLPTPSTADSGSDGGGVESPKDITKFTILGVDGTITGNDINITLPAGTYVTSLTPTIEITGVSVSPASGMAQNFSGPVAYTVTAADHSIKSYTVHVNVTPSSAKEITQFTIFGVPGTITGNTIAVTMPSGTNLTSLPPLVSIDGASVSPTSGASQNFTSPVTYTVTAADKSTKTYTVTVSVASLTAKDITQFTLLNVNGNITGTSISLTLPAGTDLSSLTPTIAITGASVSPANQVPQNFTNPVTYTVTAADTSKKTYTVTASVAAVGAKEITQFSILGANATINGTSIALTLPSGTDLTALTPTIAITGTSVSPASGMTQNFTGPVSYTVSAADSSTKVYTVTVTVAANNAKEITQFTINGINGTINSTNISLVVPAGTSLTALAPNVAFIGASVSPASGVPQNFTNAVDYTVTAADASTKVYRVTVSVAQGTVKDITQFTILGVNGTIGGNTIAVNLPAGTPLMLTPTIAINGVSVSPASGVPQNFANPVLYTVTAGDASTKIYTVTVNIAASNVKDITAFSIGGNVGQITGTNITVTMPYGTDVTDLRPTIAINGSYVTPASGVGQSFSAPVTYTVYAADGTSKAYTASVSVAPSSDKDITQFKIQGVFGFINNLNNTISLTLPANTDPADLTPTIAITGTEVSPASGVAQNFKYPVQYTVTAADQSTKIYTVTVTVAPDTAADIVDFEINGFHGLIGTASINVTLPATADLKNLIPNITITGTSVEPASGVAQDFSQGPVIYTVYSLGGTSHQYTVTITISIILPPQGANITSMVIDHVTGTINGDSISFFMPAGTDRFSMIPTITYDGVSVEPPSGVPVNLTGPTIFTVIGSDDTKHDYTVTVNCASPGCLDSG